MAQSPLIISPVGRFVSGSMTEIVKTDHLNRPIDADKYHYSIGVAFRKDDPLTNPMLQAMAAHAFTEFAQFPHIQNLIGQYNFTPRSGFSWKIKDGDQPNAEGKTNKNSEGCYVIYFSSNFVTNCADQNNASIGHDSQLMTRGNFLQVAFTVAGNGNSDSTAGIYVNPQVYRFVAYGEPITGGVDAATAFAGVAAPQLPAGASATPLASPMSTATAPSAPTPPAAPGAPSAPTPPAAPAQPGVAPHPTFANGPATPPAAPSAPVPPSAPAAPTPPAAPAVTRPTDPTHIHAAGTPGEMWWINDAWTPSPK